MRALIHLNYLAVVVSAIAVFVFAAGYYIALAGPRAMLSGAAAARSSRPAPWLMALELFKAFVVALVVAAMVSLIGITDVTGALKLGLALWIAFPGCWSWARLPRRTCPGSSEQSTPETGSRSWSSSLSWSVFGARSAVGSS